jgi:molybdenum cofactor cytidylyltransferase
MVCDQPFASASLLNDLIAAHEETLKGIIASGYNNTLGTPVLFNKKYFDDLLKLQGAEGAKKIIMKYADDVATVPFPMGAVDIDTIEDYDSLLHNSFVSP